MKKLTLLSAFLFCIFTFNINPAAAQQGKVYGLKPDKTGMMDASKVEGYMDKKTRINITIRGKVLKVTKQKGGWFTMDAGNGKIIAAHFQTYNVNLPASLAGKYVIADGIAQKQFLADDMQHLAGDSVNGKKGHAEKANAKQKLTFEVKGLMVE